MFYLEEKKVYDFGAEMNLLSPVPVIKFKPESELDDFKYQVGDIVYRVTDSLRFVVFQVIECWWGSTATSRISYGVSKKCYKVGTRRQSLTSSQYETALFKTKEEAFSDRYEKETIKGDSARLKKLSFLRAEHMYDKH